MIIDTTNKTIQVQTETLGEIVEQLQKMFPDEWKEYKLLTTTFTPTIERQIIREVHPYREIPYVPYIPTTDPYYIPWTTCGETETYGDPTKFGTLGKTQESRDFINVFMGGTLVGSGWKYGLDVEQRGQA